MSATSKADTMMLCLTFSLLTLSDMVLGEIAVAAEDQYSFFIHPVTWEQAELTCQKLNRTLVNIKSSIEQKTLDEFLDNFQKRRHHRWIGLRRIDPSNNTGLEGTEESTKPDSERFIWTDGSIAQYTNWADSQPDFGEDGTRKCAFSHLKNRKWYMASCGSTGIFQFICQKRTGEVLPIKPSVKMVAMKIIQKTGHAKVYNQPSGQAIKVFTVADGTHTIHGLTRIEYIIRGKLEDCIAMCQSTTGCSRYAYTRFGVLQANFKGGDAFCMMYSA